MYRYPNFPEHVYVELTNVCNASCTICATTTMQRKREIMRMPLFQKVVDECARYKAKKILPFLHGESLLVPGISNYFRYVRQASPDTHVNLTTNGSKLSAKLTETFLGEDLLDSIIISIDGGDKQTYEAIRKGLDYDEVRTNVLHFIRRRNQMDKTKPKVSIAMVIVDENKSTRAELKKIWQEADEVRSSVYFNWAGKLKNRDRFEYKGNFCERLYHYITILADGRVGMCCFDSEAQHVVGDINKQSVHEVWHSKEFRRKRKLLYDRDFDQLTLCSSCDYINHPSWITPLVRFRPYVRDAFPKLTTKVENFYKRWLMR